MQLQDGFSTIVSFASDPNVLLWEKSLTPPGVDGGPHVPTETMRNLVFKTKAPQGLVEITDVKFKAAYDPGVLVSILTLVNFIDAITVTFSDGGQYVFTGFLQSFKPDEVQMGTQPTAEVTIVVTNTQVDAVGNLILDALGAPVEDTPVFVPAP